MPCATGPAWRRCALHQRPKLGGSELELGCPAPLGKGVICCSPQKILLPMLLQGQAHLGCHPPSFCLEHALFASGGAPKSSTRWTALRQAKASIGKPTSGLQGNLASSKGGLAFFETTFSVPILECYQDVLEMQGHPGDLQALPLGCTMEVTKAFIHRLSPRASQFRWHP